MNKRRLAGLVLAVLALVVGFFVWDSRYTTFTYAVPDELVGATIDLDGKRVENFAKGTLTFRLTKARHQWRLDKPGMPPVLMETDLSGS